MTYEEILSLPPFGVDKEDKRRILAEGLLELTKHHMAVCNPYRNVLKALGWQAAHMRDDNCRLEEIPFLPVRIFKEMELKSVPSEDVFKLMTSSGTSGQSVSRIFLDKGTSAAQQKTLVRIVSDFMGSARLPMVIVDCPSVVKNRAMFSARGAGVLGFSIFGRKKIYALDNDMRLDVEGLRAFLQEHQGEKILLFGFTFMVWQYFYKALREVAAKGERLDLSNALLIHGGGWKKLTQEAVSTEKFKNALREVCGLNQVADYYGMAEQTGCVYMECEKGHLHASTYSDVIMRRAKDFSVCNVGEKGMIQVLSLLPRSYPGHSLLTEDEGVLLGIDDCPCGRKGKYFKVLGRMKHAEIRGCSDTYASGI
ncbi:MAG: acyl-protein synthetase [Selenomonas ruminantium]|nr:acyl-protein synthetase [Selenomonas ruminantium]